MEIGEERAERSDSTLLLDARSNSAKMATRFDKRAMGHPLPNAESNSRPTLSSFQDEVAASERARRTRTTSAGNNSTAAGEAVDALAEKVKEIDLDPIESTQGQDDGRSLKVSRIVGFRWRKVGSQISEYSMPERTDASVTYRNDYSSLPRQTLVPSPACSTALSCDSREKSWSRYTRLTRRTRTSSAGLTLT